MLLIKSGFSRWWRPLRKDIKRTGLTSLIGFIFAFLLLEKILGTRELANEILISIALLAGGIGSHLLFLIYTLLREPFVRVNELKLENESLRRKQMDLQVVVGHNWGDSEGTEYLIFQNIYDAEQIHEFYAELTVIEEIEVYPGSERKYPQFAKEYEIVGGFLTEKTTGKVRVSLNPSENVSLQLFKSNYTEVGKLEFLLENMDEINVWDPSIIERKGKYKLRITTRGKVGTNPDFYSRKFVVFLDYRSDTFLDIFPTGVFDDRE